MNTYSNIYFIGIGGIGMSALARWYHHQGYNVSGYDRTPSPVTSALESEGIAIHFEDNASMIPPTPEDTLVIYTPAIPSDMGELTYVRRNGYRTVKRSEALEDITAGHRCLAVSGTHGKTTTSTMLPTFSLYRERDVQPSWGVFPATTAQTCCCLTAA